MNNLAIAIGVVLSCFSFQLWAYHVTYSKDLNAVENLDDADNACQQNLNSAPRLLPLLVMITVLISLTLSIYSVTGRFSDWNQGKLDEHTDYLLAAEITKGRQQVDKTPEDEIALLKLAESYSAGGMYQDAIDTVDKLLRVKGEVPELMGMKANAMYYRDNRVIAADTGIVIARTLALHREELHTRLLLATDAYLNADYSNAIKHWRILLENQTQYVNRKAINNAILKAQSKL